MSTFNIDKQIQYWKTTALSDFETAEILIEKGKLLQGLFFCHLTIEKLLKAHFVKATETLSPKTHDLIYLMKKANLSLDEKYQLTLVTLMTYQLEGRYPDNFISSPAKEKAIEYLSQTKELLEWLVQKL
ncbi:MAG: HEPN domain-containing protein [Methanococcaceae archaeon]